MAVETAAAAEIWQEALRRIEGHLSKPTFELYLKNMSPVALEGDTFVFAVPSRHAKEWIESRHAALIHGALQEVLARAIHIHLTVTDDGPLPQAPEAVARTTDGVPLSPKYTFDTFVIGSGNRFAHAAAMAVAEATTARWNSGPNTGTSMYSSLTTSSFWPAKSARRRSSSTRSTRCTRPAGKLSSPVTVRPRRSPR